MRCLAGLLPLVAAAGCFSPSPPAGTPCPTGICPSGLVCSPASMTCEREAFDAAIDAVDATPAGCFGAGVATVCPDAPITGQTQITVSTTQTLNTNTSTLCLDYHLPNGMADTAYCLVAAKTVTVTSTGRVNITGTRPLIVLATNALTVDGTIDAASHRGGLAGPNADASACVAGEAPTLDDGGPGGSFGSAGGAGGGTAGGPTVAPAPPAPMVTTLRGGCPGRAGGGGNAGAPGRGGGAVLLIADGTLTISGTINASGASGVGAGLSAGGGGGGSGGMIVLEAPTITVAMSARLFANGGGGGEGGGGSNGGNDGTDSTAPAIVGVGGKGSAGAGGDGGDGAAGGSAAKNGTTDTDSGGGGGGGFGVIRVFPAQQLAGSISPPPS